MRQRRLTTRPRIASLVALLLLASPVHASTVTNLRADFHDGQTFLTWDNQPGTGWIYHIFSSSAPLTHGKQLDDAIELAQVGDASGVDQRMTELLGQQVTFRIAEDQPPLEPTRGLFVHTPSVGALTYFAVTAERVGLGQARKLVVGQNVTPEPVWERVQRPKPVWQRTLTSPPGEDYVLWTSHAASPLFPAMANAPSRAYHVGVVRGQPGGALILHGHGRGGNLFNALMGTGVPGEWVLAIDDYVPTSDYATFYFGYEQNYDIEQPLNFPRTTGGLVADYTERRVMYLLEWANAEMPHDPDRVYAMGASMGGSFAFFLAWHHPDRIAGSLAVIPKLCLAYRPDVYPALRESLDRMWGSPDLDLPSTVGLRVFQWMDGREQARIHRRRGSAPIVGFCGLNDGVVGWAEKVAYFEAMERERSGGTWFWDERRHFSPHEESAWFPMMGATQLYKFRRNQSYPAFSDASSNDHYGDGDPATADPIGSINGALDWDPASITDEPLRWEIVLQTRGLTTQDGVLGAPDVVDVDVTPRRLQQFIVAQRVDYRWEVRRLSDGDVLQSGIATPDEDAILTLPRVQVRHEGVRLTVAPTSVAGVTPDLDARRQPHLALSQNPVRGRASLTVQWPTEGDGRVELYDMQGRLVRTEFQGAVAERLTERTFRTEGLAPGLYVLSARQGAARSTRRVTVLD
jgi:dienelactone hydrolase